MELFGFTIIRTKKLDGILSKNELLNKLVSVQYKLNSALKENRTLLKRKIELLEQKLNNKPKVNRKSPVFEAMPNSFTREELKAMLKEKGVKSQARKFIFKWRKRGWLTEVSKDLFVKVTELKTYNDGND